MFNLKKIKALEERMKIIEEILALDFGYLGKRSARIDRIEKELNSLNLKKIQNKERLKRSDMIINPYLNIYEIRELRNKYDIKEITPYVIRINGQLDIFPKSHRYFHLKTKQRGNFKDISQINKLLTI